MSSSKKGHQKASCKAATKRIRKIVAQAQEKDFSKRVTDTQSSSKFSGVGSKGGKIATRKTATKQIGKTVAQADDVSKGVMDPQSSMEHLGLGRRGRRKVSSKTATTCIGETVAQEQKDVSKRVIDQPSSTNLSGVAIRRQSQVHAEHVKQFLKVVTTSPQLVPAQLTPASSQPIATSHHVYASSTAAGIAVPKVQFTALSFLLPTGETGSTPTGIAPNLTTMP